MIWDCFLFHNELDVLDMRFEELYPVVDRFVLLESTMTFSGKDKIGHFSHNIDRYKPYHDKIIRIVQVGDDTLDAWGREKHARNSLAFGLEAMGYKPDEAGAKPDDTIILSDVDEIPRRSVVEALAGTEPVSLVLDKFSYALNCLTTERHGATKAFPYSFLKDKSMQEIREMDLPRVDNAGWEFSSLGTAEQVAEKLGSFSHTEFDVPGISDVESIQRRMDAREDVVGRGWKHQVVPIDDTWPEAVKRDPERWKDYIWSL
jgi:hypothetical protein